MAICLTRVPIIKDKCNWSKTKNNLLKYVAINMCITQHIPHLGILIVFSIPGKVQGGVNSISSLRSWGIQSDFTLRKGEFHSPFAAARFDQFLGNGGSVLGLMNTNQYNKLDTKSIRKNIHKNIHNGMDIS